MPVALATFQKKYEWARVPDNTSGFRFISWPEAGDLVKFAECDPTGPIAVGSEWRMLGETQWKRIAQGLEEPCQVIKNRPLRKDIKSKG
jgi:hypothetical protein